MNIKSKISIILFGLIAPIGILYAINTLIVDIDGGQTADLPGSANTRIMTLGDGDLRYMNKDNDKNSIGDYFQGYYYDPAYGVFQTNASNNNVRVSSSTAPGCPPGYDGRKLTGYSYNPDFGFVNFNHDTNNYVYICIPQDGNDDTAFGTLYGYAYSSYIGFQNFNGIILDSSVDRGDEHDSDGRFLKVDGIVSTQNPEEAVAGQFTDDIRVLGNITKATLRRNIQQKVYASIRNVNPENGSTPYSVSGLGAAKWTPGDGKILQNGEVLYFGDMGDADIIVSGNDSITGNKTLVVEGGNIYITENIRGSGVLGLIAIQKDNQGGNIYIHPRVTDIHAIMYADRSVLSVEDANDDDNYEKIADAATQSQELASQLYIYGSIFSENTIGGSLTTTCPYFVSSCDSNESQKYDLNLLRRYILVQPLDADGNPDGDKIPQFSGEGAKESFMGDTSNSNTQSQKPGYRVYPLIIDYNPQIQQTPPPFFD